MADATVSNPMKVCRGCKAAKPPTIEFFGPHRMGANGLHPRCRACKKVADAIDRARPDQKARQKAWRDANKNYAKAYNAKYRETHKSTPYVRAWRAKNLEHARKGERQSAMRRRRSNPALQLKERIASRLGFMVKGKNGRRLEELLGYTRHELRAHIERQFTRGMSWEALMAGKIHIDHIVPVAAFRIESVDDPDFKACWALTNLRPMWASENCAKGAKRTHLL
jgi:hypothetical protein